MTSTEAAMGSSKASGIEEVRPEMDQDEPAPENPNIGDAHAGFVEMTEGYQAWRAKKEEEERDWGQRMAEKVQEVTQQAEVRMWQVVRLQSEVETKVEEQAAKVVVEKEAEEEKCKEEEEVVLDVMLQHKQRILDEWQCPDEIWVMQAETWAGKCGICRVREGRRIRHGWRDCPAHPQDRLAVREAYTEVIVALEADGATHREGMFLAVCPGCSAPRWMCWARAKARGSKAVPCRFRGVAVESVAAILGTEARMVQEWEARRGQGRGGSRRSSEGGGEGERYGYGAMGRVWRTFGWLGIWDIRGVGIDELQDGYMERLRVLTWKEKEKVVSKEEMKEARKKRRQLYGVWEGEIGGWEGGEETEA